MIGLRRLAVLAALVLTLLLAGAAGLALSERVGLWYAFRWALDTAATVGGFRQPRTLPGQIIEVGLVVVGVGTLFYALGAVAELFAAGHVFELVAHRREMRKIDSLADHHIICGFGRVGRQVAKDLRAAGAQLVVVDPNPENRLRAEAEGLPFVEADASDDDALRRAGIERARSVVVCADSDAHNVFITLTARELRADITIVARAAVEDTEKKLKRAGADRVVSPYKTSGSEMARLALHRQLSGVVEVGQEFRLEELEVAGASAAVGRTVGDIQGGAVIVGRRRGNQLELQPAAETVLGAGDVVVALGSGPALERLERLLEGGRE